MFLVLFVGRNEDVLHAIEDKEERGGIPFTTPLSIGGNAFSLPLSGGGHPFILPASSHIRPEEKGFPAAMSVAKMSGGVGGGGKCNNKRLRGMYEYKNHGHELDIELQKESRYKQQAQALKFCELAFQGAKEAIDEDQRSFWKRQISIAQAQLTGVQAKLPSAHLANQEML